jgi:hypothetical protein
VLKGGDVGGYVKGVVNLPLSDKAALRVVGYDTEYAGFVDALGEGGTRKNNVNDGYRRGGRARCCSSRPRTSASPRAWSIRRSTPAASIARKRSTCSPTRSPPPARPSPWASASSTCCWTRASATRPSWAT